MSQHHRLGRRAFLKSTGVTAVLGAVGARPGSATQATDVPPAPQSQTHDFYEIYDRVGTSCSKSHPNRSGAPDDSWRGFLSIPIVGDSRFQPPRGQRAAQPLRPRLALEAAGAYSDQATGGDHHDTSIEVTRANLFPQGPGAVGISEGAELDSPGPGRYRRGGRGDHRVGESLDVHGRLHRREHAPSVEPGRARGVVAQ